MIEIMDAKKEILFKLADLRDEITETTILNCRDYSQEEIEERTEKGKKLFDEFVSHIDEDIVDRLERLSEVICQCGNRELGKYAFDKAIKKFPKHAPLYIGRATEVYRRNNIKKDKELADINKAIELDPDNPFFYSMRAIYYLDAEEYQKALADYTKAIELEPEDDTYYGLRSSVYEQLGMEKEAEADLKREKERENNDYHKKELKESRKWWRDHDNFEKERKEWKAKQKK